MYYTKVGIVTDTILQCIIILLLNLHSKQKKGRQN